VVLYRVSRFPRRRLAYIVLSIVATAVFGAVALLLIPRFGAYGAAVAPTAGFTVGALSLLLLSETSSKTVPLSYRRWLGAMVLAGLCYLLYRVGGELYGTLRPALGAAFVIAYPILLVASRVVPREHVGHLLNIGRRLVSRPSVTDIGDRLSQLEHREAAALEELVRKGGSPARAATRLNMDEASVLTEGVRALRRLSDSYAEVEPDPRLGVYLFSSRPPAEAHVLLRQLETRGVSPVEVNDLEERIRALRRMPDRMWATVGRDSTHEKPT
jgi:hypothetical protein